MAKLWFTIGEAAEILDENVSLVRFWSNSFSDLLNPRRNAKGNRLFSPDDIETLKVLHHLIKGRGMTLEGARKQILADKKKVSADVKVLDTLKGIKARLVEIRKEL